MAERVLLWRGEGWAIGIARLRGRLDVVGVVGVRPSRRVRACYCWHVNVAVSLPRKVMGWEQWAAGQDARRIRAFESDEVSSFLTGPAFNGAVPGVAVRPMMAFDIYG